MTILIQHTWWSWCPRDRSFTCQPCCHLDTIVTRCWMPPWLLCIRFQFWWCLLGEKSWIGTPRLGKVCTPWSNCALEWVPWALGQLHVGFVLRLQLTTTWSFWTCMQNIALPSWFTVVLGTTRPSLKLPPECLFQVLWAQDFHANRFQTLVISWVVVTPGHLLCHNPCVQHGFWERRFWSLSVSNRQLPTSLSRVRLKRFVQHQDSIARRFSSNLTKSGSLRGRDGGASWVLHGSVRLIWKVFHCSKNSRRFLRSFLMSCVGKSQTRSSLNCLWMRWPLSVLTLTRFSSMFWTYSPKRRVPSMPGDHSFRVVPAVAVSLRCPWNDLWLEDCSACWFRWWMMTEFATDMSIRMNAWHWTPSTLPSTLEMTWSWFCVPQVSWLLPFRLLGCLPRFPNTVRSCHVVKFRCLTCLPFRHWDLGRSTGVNWSGRQLFRVAPTRTLSGWLTSGIRLNPFRFLNWWIAKGGSRSFRSFSRLVMS